MKNMAMALVASAGMLLAPVAPLLAETVAAKDADAIAKSWVPATPAEKTAARGGTSKGGSSYSLWGLQNTFCNNVTINIFFCRRIDG